MLVYRATGTISGRLVWLDRTGRELAEVAEAADYRAPALSPDGRRIAIRRTDPQTTNVDLWVIEPGRGTTTRFTFDAGVDANPIWSPDGSQIAWASDRGGSDGLWIKSASGIGEDRLVAATAAGTTGAAPTDWSRDGSYLLYHVFDPKMGVDMYAVPMRGEHKPEVVLRTPFNEGRGRFSPDGRWIVYESMESGRPEVYVASFRGTAGKWQVSTNGGSDPCWSPDGREIFYFSADQRLMVTPVTLGATFEPGTARGLFRVRTEVGRRRNVYCVAPDGQRFLFQVPIDQSSTPMTVVANWRGGTGRK